MLNLMAGISDRTSPALRFQSPFSPYIAAPYPNPGLVIAKSTQERSKSGKCRTYYALIPNEYLYEPIEIVAKYPLILSIERISANKLLWLLFVHLDARKL